MVKKYLLLVFMLLVCSTFVSATVSFSKDFDSGSYDSIVQVTEDQEYNITLFDNPIGNNDWLYFNATNVLNRNITFNIVNVNGEFNFWNSTTDTHMIFSCDADNDSSWIRITNFNYPNNGSVFTFWYNFTECNSVRIAPIYPYPYSRMVNYYDGLSSTYLTKSIIGTSVLDRNLYSFKITNSLISDDDKKSIYIISRQHPGETYSSWSSEYIINHLLNESNTNSTELRNNFIFYVMPMLNPDGVFLGYTRTNSDFVDLNRAWDNVGSEEVNIIRPYIVSINNLKSIDLFLDVHSLGDGLSDTGFCKGVDLANYTITKNYYKSEAFLNKIQEITTLADGGTSAIDLRKGKNYALGGIGVKSSILVEYATHNATYDLNDLNQDAIGFTVAISELWPLPILWTNLNENNGTIAHDSSGNSNDGTIAGATWTTDGVLKTLTAITDYTINPTTGLFTIVNNDYSWAELFVTWDYNLRTDANNNANAILGNTSTGITQFFVSISPVYSILAVLVIILVLVVLVRVVQTPNGRGGAVQL